MSKKLFSYLHIPKNALIFLQVIFQHTTTYYSRNIFFMKLRFIAVLCLLLPIITYAQPVPDSLVYSFSFSDSTKRNDSLTSDIDLRTQPGSIILALGKTKNLGSNAVFTTVYIGSYPPSAQDPNIPDTAKINGMNLGDNKFTTFNEFPTGPSSNIGSYIKIDLRSIRNVNKVVLVNFADLPQFYRQRPIAFSLFSGLDSNSLSRVFQETNNVDSTISRYTINIADVRPVQFLRLTLDRMNPPNSTIISEVQIYGDGYVPSGTFVTKVDSFASSSANFGNISAYAKIPSGTNITFQMRTGTTKKVDSLHWSDWSSPIVFSSATEALSGSRLSVSEPRRYFQWKVVLNSANLETPSIDSLHFTYQYSLVADSVYASVSPSEIPAFEKATLHYFIDAVISPANLGIDTIIIFTQSAAAIQNVLVNNSAVPFFAATFPDKLIVSFRNTIFTSSKIEIIFSTRLITSTKFKSEVISKAAAWNPQSVDYQKNAFGEAWSVSTTGISSTTLVNVRIDPNPFTPNGDGKNDQTIVDFAIANIVKTKSLRIAVYNLLGKKIRSLADLQTGVAPFYGDPRKGGKGILWDGKDDEGKVVLPGVYLMQISIDTDNGGEFITKTVVVSY